MHSVSFDPAFMAKVSAARPAEMTALLLEAAIDALEETVVAIDENRIQDRYTASARAMKIVGFLHETLNYEDGGDVAINLDQVYRLAMARIARINPFNEAVSARAAIRVLQPQAVAWRAVDAEIATPDMPEITTLPGLVHAAGPMPQPVYAS